MSLVPDIAATNIRESISVRANIIGAIALPPMRFCEIFYLRDMLSEPIGRHMFKAGVCSVVPILRRSFSQTHMPTDVISLDERNQTRKYRKHRAYRYSEGSWTAFAVFR
jgi:hypothetical protein